MLRSLFLLGALTAVGCKNSVAPPAADSGSALEYHPDLVKRSLERMSLDRCVSRRDGDALFDVTIAPSGSMVIAVVRTSGGYDVKCIVAEVGSNKASPFSGSAAQVLRVLFSYRVPGAPFHHRSTTLSFYSDFDLAANNLAPMRFFTP